MPKITPLDSKICMEGYLQFLKALKDAYAEENLTCTSPEPCGSNSTLLYDGDIHEMDEDSKMSAITLSSICSSEETAKKRPFCVDCNVLQPISSWKNPRKSPRQHASTLAILSSLLYQRKRRSKTKISEESNLNLPTIPEENSQSNTPLIEQEILTPKVEAPTIIKPKTKTKSPNKYHWRFKPKINYRAIAQNIEDELDSVIDDFDKYNLEVVNDSVDFHNSRTNTTEILRLYEEGKARETDKSCRRFFNGTPGRKPGRKRKKNLTGWPNKNKRIPKREHSKEKEEILDKNSTADTTSLHADSDVDEEQPKKTEAVKKSDGSDCKKGGSDVECCDIDSLNENNKKVKKKIKNEVLQPYVYVQKLDNKLIGHRMCTPKRTVKRQKRIPGSPRSPRILRKPRGRWYKER